MEALQNKLDFFHKLGYGKDEVCKVLEKLGQEASENDLLLELIQTASRPQERENYPPYFRPHPIAHGSCKGSLLPQPPSEEEAYEPTSNLRPIVIDGSNTAMSHGNKEVFSCLGIQLVVDWFKKRRHQSIKVFVPSWRKEPSRCNNPITDQHILELLEKQAILVYTPSRKLKGKRMVCYDDRYIMKLAYEQDGVIVSNDNFRDLQNENPEWKWFIEQRLLMYSFVNNKFMPPDDPLGRHGPSLDNFLRKKPLFPEPKWQLCPYDKKCTYGIKCKFSHTKQLNRDHLSVADELRAKTKTYLSTQKTGGLWGTKPIQNKDGDASNLIGPKSGEQIGNRSISGFSLAIFHNNSPNWKREGIQDSADDRSNTHQSNWQPESILLQDQARDTGAILKPFSGLSLSARNHSTNIFSEPTKYEDLLDERHQDHHFRYNQNSSLAHGLCLDCSCLEVCNFQGCCRIQTPQTLQPPLSFVRSSLTVQPKEQFRSTISSAESFSYCNNGDIPYPGNFQAKTYGQVFSVDTSTSRTEDPCISLSNESQILALNPLSEEQADIQPTLCLGFPYNASVSTFSSIAQHGNLQNSCRKETDHI